jgi:branched-subunit amino acid transport protein
VSAVWISVIAVGAATVALKAVGPVLLGQRPLPLWLAGPVAFLAPAVLAAFVVTAAVGGDRAIVADARLVGVGAGAIAVALRAPILAVVVVAAAAAALARLVT